MTVPRVGMDENLRTGPTGKNTTNKVPPFAHVGVGEGEQIKPPSLLSTWWSIDPGAAHVGVATWSGEKLTGVFETTPDGLLDALYRASPGVVVVESFSLAGPRYAREKAKQAVDTIRLIGAVYGLGVALGYANRGFAMFEQQPSVRHVAQSSPFWFELVKEHPLDGNSHVRSAVAHGVYFLHFNARGRRYVRT